MLNKFLNTKSDYNIMMIPRKQQMLWHSFIYICGTYTDKSRFLS